MMVYKVSSDGHTIEDFDPHAFEEDATIVFPSVIDGKKITGIRMPYKTKTTLNSLFGSFDVIIENGIKEIDERMFAESKIRSITIPPSVEIIPAYCFWDSKLEKVIFSGKSSLWKIDNQAFRSCRELKSISVPETVSAIGERAFCDCGLTEIDLSGLKSSLYIAEYAFSECKWLKKVALPEVEITLKRNVFYYSEALESVEMHKSNIDTIPEGTFMHCKRLKLIILPGSVTHIGHRAFSNCNSLKTVGLCNTSVYEIDDLAFAECILYSDDKFPNTLKSIGNKAFIRCGLKSLSLPLFSLEEIGDEVFVDNPISGELDLRPFLGCDRIGNSIFAATKVESVLLVPFSGVNVSGKFMFDSCQSLKQVKMLAASTLYDGMFNSCYNLEVVTLPETLRHIPPSTFRMTKNLKKINFPCSLQSIDYSAFYTSGLKNLDLSNLDSVFIDDMAFKNVTFESIKLPLYGCEICSGAFNEKEFNKVKDSSPFITVVD